MNNVKGSVASGQGLVEYVLLIALVAIVVVAILLVLGAQVGGVFSQVIVSTSGASDPVAQPTAANALTLNVMDDFLRRIRAFHDETGHWPRSGESISSPISVWILPNGREPSRAFTGTRMETKSASPIGQGMTSRSM